MPEWVYVEPVREWPELVVAINGLEGRLRANARPVAADILLAGYAEFHRELIALGRKMSAFATEELRRQERATRVRPDTLGAGPGPRLEDKLVAGPFSESLIPGAIGVANETLLDAEVPWWITNEIGSSANVGRKLYGFFYDQNDAAPPSRSEFRVHPLFQPGKSPVSGSGIIEEPIPARYFIAKAVPIINAAWQAEFQVAKDRMNTAMSRALATFR